MKFQPRKSSHFKQGTIELSELRKYLGKKIITYRSSWELEFIRRLEYDSNVLKWSSEPIEIPYISKEKVNGKWIEKRRNYNPDFLVILKSGKVLLIEIKPLSQVPLFENTILSDPAQMKNQCKWKAAIGFCKKQGWEFRIITEQNLKKPLI
jgi:hypothetical protein